MTKYCFFLPAETSLFLHIYHAFDEYLPRRYRRQITPCTFDESAAADDSVLAARIAGKTRYKGMEILGGICDPRQAALNGLNVYASAVKRLGFYLVLPHKRGAAILKGRPNPVIVYGHGGTFDPNKPPVSALTSTSQALARSVAAVLGRPEVRSKPFDDLYLKDGEMAVSCNLPLAFALEALALVDLVPLADLFPEWSRLFVSAIVAPGWDRIPSALVEALISAVQYSCRDLRFNKSVEDVGSLLRKRFPAEFDVAKIQANAHAFGYKGSVAGLDLPIRTAKALRELRIIPSNVETTRLGSHLTDALWTSEKLTRTCLYTQDERLDLLDRNNSKSAQPPTVAVLDGAISTNAREKQNREFLPLYLASKRNVNDAAPADVAILTALSEELMPVRQLIRKAKLIQNRNEHLHSCYGAELLVPESDDVPRRVILATPEKQGRLLSSLLTSYVLDRWKPRVIILAGIAAGIRHPDMTDKDPFFGDILLPDNIKDYEGQKVTDTKTSRTKQSQETMGAAQHYTATFRTEAYEVNARLLRLAKTLSPSLWHRSIGCERPASKNPRSHPNVLYIDKPSSILCGDKVVSSSFFLKDLINQVPNAIGLEMESAGVAAAIRADGGRCSLIVVKAVSDFANVKKGSKTTAMWRKYALASSAAFAFQLCKHPSLL